MSKAEVSKPNDSLGPQRPIHSADDEQPLPDFVFRFLDPGDLPDLISLIDSAAFRRDAFIPRGQAQSWLTRKQHRVLGAFVRRGRTRSGRVLVGFAVESNASRLDNLWVQGRFRRRGVGRELLFLLNPAQVRAKMDTHTGDPTNFYERCGFVADEVVASRYTGFKSSDPARDRRPSSKRNIRRMLNRIDDRAAEDQS